MAKDVSAERPDRAKAMLALREKWDADNRPPRWADRRRDGEAARAGKKTKKEPRS